MAFTHTYKIDVPGVDQSGEIVFNGGNKPAYNTDNPMRIELELSDEINDLIKCVKRLHDKAGGLNEITFLINP